MHADDIRPATLADSAAVEVCVGAAYQKYLTRMPTPPAPLQANYAALIQRGVVYVIDDPANGSVTGLIVCWPDDGAMFVDNVAVHPDHQGHGLGRRLMAFAEHLALSAQLAEVRLYTNELMTENLEFYGGLGFEETARRVDHGYRRVFLRKRLGPEPSAFTY